MAGGQVASRDYSRPRQMQLTEPTRQADPSARKRHFIEQRRAEFEARRREQSHQSSYEPAKVTVQVCAAFPPLHARLSCLNQGWRHAMTATIRRLW